MNNFKEGDVVYLKSGSDPMTIVSIYKDHCHVAWHDKDKIEQRTSYPKEALTKENPIKIPPSSKVGY